MSSKAMQRYYESERRDDDRCPRCGSRDTWPSDWYSLPGGDYQDAGLSCGSCHLRIDAQGEVWDNAPFILPGDPGSHDQLSDYDPLPATAL